MSGFHVATPTRSVTGEDGAMAGESLKGKLLVATPLLQEPTFGRTVIALLEHTRSDGAIGVVINRPTSAPIADVLPGVAELVTPPAVVFDGGPVSPQTAIALANTHPGADGAGVAPVVAPLATVDLDADPALLAASLRTLRVFAGYAGWAAGQLEGEIAEGAWYVVDSLPADPFVADPDGLRAAVLRRQGWPLAAAAHSPLDPALN
jgi:putative transcriptional regulator